MKASPTCDLYILSAVTDLAFIERTIPHQIRNCNISSGNRYLVVDTAEISGYYSKNREINSLDNLLEIGYRLKNSRIIDEVIQIDYQNPVKKKEYNNHFGRNYPETHCFRGYPYWGSILPFEHSDSDYIVHLDSDMLVYQDPDYNWIKESIDLMERDKDIVCCLPLSGPPTQDLSLFQHGNEYTYDSRGFYRFKDFTSRIFVMHKERFLNICPMNISWLSWREPIKSRLFGNGKMLCWEVTVTRAIEKSKYWRADLASPKAWSLHPPERGERFNKYLSEIIKLVDAGVFPQEQSGHYDLNLDWWEEMITTRAK
jgi:hypothetical protein